MANEPIDNSLLGISQQDTSGFFNPTLINSHITTVNELKLSFIIYENPKFFTTDSTDNSEVLNCSAKQKISNKVISMSPIPSLTSGKDLVTTQFGEQAYETNCSNTASKRVVNYKCVFWEEAKRDWNDFGCQYEKNVTNGKTLHYCFCNHTTNFALLMVNLCV